jgi:pimeloyl-ACP methyl ester carboxylesterase
VAFTPGWPDDPETVEEAAEHPQVFGGKSIGQVADHFETIIRGLNRKAAIIGHSIGGLLTQILAGRGLPAVSVFIDPAPFRVLPLPISALKSSLRWPGPRPRSTHREPPQWLA